MSTLVPFECGRESGGRFVHAFLPDGVAKYDWRPEHLVDVPALVARCGLPHYWRGEFIWVPAWLEPVIKMFMTGRPACTLETFVSESAP